MGSMFAGERPTSFVAARTDWFDDDETVPLRAKAQRPVASTSPANYQLSRPAFTASQSAVQQHGWTGSWAQDSVLDQIKLVLASRQVLGLVTVAILTLAGYMYLWNL